MSGAFAKRPPKFWDAAAMGIIAAAIAGAGLMSSDKAYIFSGNADGCGIYCLMALNYDVFFLTHEFDTYYFRKSLLSLIGFLTAKMADIDLTPRNMNVTLETVSAVALILAAVFWGGIAKATVLRRSLAWLGFAFLFSSQVFFKIVPHAEESPDTLSFALGMLALHFFVRSSFPGMASTIALTLLAQPQLALALMPLAVFCGDASQRNNSTMYRNLPGWRILKRIIAILELATSEKRKQFIFLTAGIALWLTIVALLLPLLRPPIHGVEQTLFWFLPFSIALQSVLIAYMLVSLQAVTALNRALHDIPDRTVIVRIVILVGLMVIFKLITAYAAQGPARAIASSFIGTLWVIYSFFYQSIQQPIKSPVAHLIFLGPIVLLLLFYWNDFCREVRRNGPGAVLTCTVILLISFNSESRHLIGFAPFLCLFAIKHLPPLRVRQVFIFAFLCVLNSRFFASFGETTHADDPFLLTWGPWFTLSTYYRALGMAAAAVAVVWIEMHFARKKSGNGIRGAKSV